MTPTPEPTPRTNAEILFPGSGIAMVHPSFARTLERETIQLKKDNDELDRQVTLNRENWRMDAEDKEKEIRQLKKELEEALMANKNANAAIGDIANECSKFCAERDHHKLRAEEWERWATEVLTDFKIPFDNHTVGLRLGITQWMADTLNQKAP